MMDELYRAAQGALKDIAHQTASVDIGLPPGAEPIPWKEQVGRFAADLPDLLRKGPRYQEIEQTYGTGAADAYLKEMLQDVWRPRERRRRL